MCTKLLISELAVRARYVTRQPYLVMRELIDSYGWQHIETDRLLVPGRTVKDRLRELLGDVPDVILFWEGFHVTGIAASQLIQEHCRVVVYCQDLHWFDEGMRAMRLASLAPADLILATYAPVFAGFYPEIARCRRVEWIPHAASPEFLLPMNDRAENVVLLSGAINEYYPLRRQLQAIAGTNRLRGRIVEHRHPGYQCNHDHQTSSAVGAGYAHRIRGCRAAFTDASKLSYVVAKYFEIPATGALLLGDDTVASELSALGFKKWIHYVPVSERTLQRELLHVLDERNHGALDQIRNNGQNLVRKHHQTNDRARRIDELCTSA